MSNAHQRFAPEIPDYTVRDGGDQFINDTGVTLRRGDIVEIRGANATSGVDKTTDLGRASWLYRASVVEFTTAGTERKALHGQFRVVTTETVAPGEQGRWVGAERCKALVKIAATADDDVPAGSGLVPQDNNVGAHWEFYTDPAGLARRNRKVIAITLEDVTLDGSGNALVPCDLSGDFGFGIS